MKDEPEIRLARIERRLTAIEQRATGLEFVLHLIADTLPAAQRRDLAIAISAATCSAAVARQPAGKGVLVAFYRALCMPGVGPGTDPGKRKKRKSR